MHDDKTDLIQNTDSTNFILLTSGEWMFHYSPYIAPIIIILDNDEQKKLMEQKWTKFMRISSMSITSQRTHPSSDDHDLPFFLEFTGELIIGGLVVALLNLILPFFLLLIPLTTLLFAISARRKALRFKCYFAEEIAMSADRSLTHLTLDRYGSFLASLKLQYAMGQSSVIFGVIGLLISVLFFLPFDHNVIEMIRSSRDWVILISILLFIYGVEVIRHLKAVIKEIR